MATASDVMAALPSGASPSGDVDKLLLRQILLDLVGGDLQQDLAAAEDAAAARAVLGAMASAGGTFGSNVGFGDGNFQIYLYAGGAFIAFDTGDYLRYDRAANKLELYRGDTLVVDLMSLAAPKLRDTAYAEYAANATLTGSIPYDDTIPQVSEGVQILSASITPKSTTNRVRARVSLVGSMPSGTNFLTAALFVAGTSDALAAKTALNTVNDSQGAAIDFEFQHTPGVTTALTYTVRAGVGSGTTFRLNGTTSARRLGGVQRATLVLEELAP